MTWIAGKPYNDLPALPPAVDLESKKVLKATIQARTALAALDQASRRIPNPTVLINTIPLLEAQASSEIENIVTTADDLFKFAQDESRATSSETKETLRYRTALFSGTESMRARPLSVTTAIEVCSIIHSREMIIRNLPGTFIGNPVTKKAGLLHHPVLYLSRYIIENKADYYRLLLAVTESGAWEEWILFILEGNSADIPVDPPEDRRHP